MKLVGIIYDTLKYFTDDERNKLIAAAKLDKVLENDEANERELLEALKDFLNATNEYKDIYARKIAVKEVYKRLAFEEIEVDRDVINRIKIVHKHLE